MQQASVTCPHCKAENHHTLVPFLDLGKHPKQKLALLTDSHFTVTCPHCNKQYTVLHELLVVDTTNQFALLLLPQTEQEEVEAETPEYASWFLRLVSNTTELKEKLLILEANLDDRTIELCKLYLTLSLEDQDVQLYFAGILEEEKKLQFSILSQTGSVEGGITCELPLYQQLLGTTTEHFGLREGVFSLVNQNWAYQRIRNNADQ